jgi:hypothetical protein
MHTGEDERLKKDIIGASGAERRGTGISTTAGGWG